MKIYTRTGDAGITSIIGGTRLPKNHNRIEAYGTIDELNSHLGLLAADASCPPPQKATIILIQNALFNIGSYLAGTEDPHIANADVATLENDIDTMTRELPPLHSFILPGGCQLAANSHIARTVCRRAERRILTAASDINLPSIILTYINRLSDWLYTFARYANTIAEIPENVWNTPK